MQPPPTATHAVFLLHGIWGNPTQMYTLKDTLVERAESEGANIDVWCCESYRGPKTFDGVDICADRIIQEIHIKIKDFDRDGRRATKFSILG